VKHQFPRRLSLSFLSFRLSRVFSFTCSLSRPSLKNVLAESVTARVLLEGSNRYFHFSAASIGTAPRWGFSASRCVPRREYTRWRARLFIWARRQSSPRIGRPPGSSSRLPGALRVLLYGIARFRLQGCRFHRALY